MNQQDQDASSPDKAIEELHRLVERSPERPVDIGPAVAVDPRHNDAAERLESESPAGHEAEAEFYVRGESSADQTDSREDEPVDKLPNAGVIPPAD